MMERAELYLRPALERLSRALTEPVMGFFALGAVTLAFAPELFDISPHVLRLFDEAEWLIVGVFAIEYAVNLVLAEEKKKHLLDPWRLVDLAIVLAAVASVLPQVTDVLRSSPVLRVVRLLRVILLGARASGSIARRPLIASAEEAEAKV